MHWKKLAKKVGVSLSAKRVFSWIDSVIIRVPFAVPPVLRAAKRRSSKQPSTPAFPKLHRLFWFVCSGRTSHTTMLSNCVKSLATRSLLAKSVKYISLLRTNYLQFQVQEYDLHINSQALLRKSLPKPTHTFSGDYGLQTLNIRYYGLRENRTTTIA